jgi:organic hydroperoxide reductase OsmC/OhrA
VPKRFEFSASIDRQGRLCAEGTEPLDLPEAWTPEHLLLGGLCRCVLASLRHHAERAELALAGAAGASGLVTKREEDGRYAFVEILCGVDVELEPPPAELGELLDLAERDCFVSASLTVAVDYEWRVNGDVVPR